MHLPPPPPPPGGLGCCPFSGGGADVDDSLLIVTPVVGVLIIIVCFVVHYFMSILVLQSSCWGRESWFLCLVCLPGVSWLLCGSSSRCHMFVCGLWLWFFLIILTYFFLFYWQMSIIICNHIRSVYFAWFVFLVSRYGCVTLPSGWHGVVFSLCLWYFLIILTYYFSLNSVIAHIYICRIIYTRRLLLGLICFHHSHL